MIKYKRRTSAKLLEVIKSGGFARESADNGMLLVGTCPECGDETRSYMPTKPVLMPLPGLATAVRTPSSLPQRAVTWAAGLKRSSPSRFEATISCECTCAHDGRPEDLKGCGAYARLKVTKK